MAEHRPPSFQRRTILIKRKLQLRLISLVFAAVLICLLVITMDLGWTLNSIVQRNPGLTPYLDVFYGLVPTFVMRQVIYLTIIVILTAIISHRIAGPIYRFERAAEAVATGDLTHRVNLREGDHLDELQDEFNEMVENLQARVERDRALIAQLRGQIDEAHKSADKQTQEFLEALRDELGKVTGEFKV